MSPTALPLQSGEQTGNPVFDGLRQKFSQLTPEEHQALASANLHPFLQPKDPNGSPINFTPPAATQKPPNTTLAGNLQSGGVIPPSAPAAPAFTPVRGLGAPSPSIAQSPSDTPITPVAGPRARPPLITNLSQDQDSLNNAIARKSGLGNLPAIARIPLKVLQGIAMATKPGQNILPFIPGTDPHRAARIHALQGQVKNDSAIEDEASKRELGSDQGANLQSEVPLHAAQAKEAGARADAIAHPQPKEEMEGKTLETDQGIFQWNPDTKRYDVKAGNSKAPKEAGTVHQLDDGSLILAHPDGTATAVTLDGKPVKGKVAEKEPNQYADFKADYAKSHPGADATEIQKAFEKNKQQPERPKTELVEVPDGKGGFVTREVGGGASLPANARTLGGVNSEATKNAESEDTANKAKSQAQQDYTTVKHFVDNPSPTGDVAIIMHFMGAVKPDNLGKMRFNKNEQDFIVKTRSSFGDLQALGQKVMNGQKLTPAQRQDMLKTMGVIAGTGAGDPNVRKFNPATGKLE